MNKPDARALIAKLNRQIEATLLQQEIVAPLLPNGRIRTRIDNLVYEFQPQGNFVGWGLFQPVNEQQAQCLGEALPWQRSLYLEQFPILRLILLWPIGDKDVQDHSSVKKLQRAGVWLALPYNTGDAKQRFNLAGNEPLQVFLCDALNGAASFERVLARVDGKTLWYDGPDALANPIEAEWLRDQMTAFEQEGKEPTQFLAGLSATQRMALLFAQIHYLETQTAQEIQNNAPEPNAETPTATQPPSSPVVATEGAESSKDAPKSGWRKPEKRFQQRINKMRFEQRLRHALTKADAVLHTYTETNNRDGSAGPIVVEWSEKGQTYRYRTLIDRTDKSLGVVSSGICLSGRDRDFDLTSLVSVMRGGNDYD